MNEFEKIVQVSPPFDRRNADPKLNYGIHGMDLKFVLKGELGATQFLVYTPLHLPHVADELFNSPERKYNPFRGMGADLGYHSYKPMWDDQKPMSDCDILGCDCYYDGSGLAAEELYVSFLQQGEPAVWRKLEQYYTKMFSHPD